MEKKALIVEDEIDIALLIKAQLSLMKLPAEIIHNGAEAIEIIKARSSDFSIYIIDRMLPGKSGTEICKFIRENNDHSPILMVTALAQSENIIEGLDSGADDYITKPFEMDVLLARVRSQLRRLEAQGKEQEIIKFKELEIDTKKCDVKISGKEILLTHTEFQILSSLAIQPDRVFTREQLIKQIIGDNVHVTHRTIDTHVAGLRKKLGNCSQCIKTVRGIGYRFLSEDDLT